MTIDQLLDYLVEARQLAPKGGATRVYVGSHNNRIDGHYEEAGTLRLRFDILYLAAVNTRDWGSDVSHVLEPERLPRD